MGERNRVLVVDDDPSIRLLCRVNLELDGHDVAEAATVEEAAERLREQPVDVAILDVHVGAGDGLALLRDLRRDRPTVAVALLSGTADRDRVEAAGADAVLGKPFTLEELRDTIASLALRRGGAPPETR